jgi:hypothetical protein
VQNSTGESESAVADGAVTAKDHIQKTSTSVPEASTWGMMLLGFAGLAYAAYRRSAKPRLGALG